MVETPPSVSATGKRERAYYPTRDKAKAHASKLRAQFMEHGSNAGAIPPALAEEASKAAAKLKPWNVSLTQAVNEYINQREREAASSPASDAVDAWLKSCSGLRPRTVRSYGHTAEKLKSALGATNLAKVTACDLEEALDLKDARGSGAALRFRNCRAFWRWCATKKWCDKSIVDEITKIKTSNEGEIVILNPEDISLLMKVCEKHAPKFCAHFALLIFGGIRAEEVVRLEVELVGENLIELPARVTKKKKRRYVEPTQNLKAWLRKHPFKPSSEWPKQFDRIRRIAGWDIKDARQLPDEIKTPTKGKWPQNCLRHSHASYALQTGKTLKDLLFEFGHTGSPDLLRTNYAKRAEKKAALEFFSIVPKGTKKPQTISAA